MQSYKGKRAQAEHDQACSTKGPPERHHPGRHHHPHDDCTHTHSSGEAAAQRSAATPCSCTVHSSARCTPTDLQGTPFSQGVSARAFPDEELCVWPTASPEGERKFEGAGRQNDISTHTHTHPHTRAHTQQHTAATHTSSTQQQQHTQSRRGSASGLRAATALAEAACQPTRRGSFGM